MQVVDASVVGSALLAVDGHRDWSEAILETGSIVVPELMLFEVANLIRRSVAHGAVTPDAGAVALADLVRLPLRESVPFAALADRTWELRANLTTYDASYVAVAELFDCRLATLDHRLACAVGPRCEIVTPESR